MPCLQETDRKKKESVLVEKTSGRIQESVIGSNTMLTEAGSGNVSDSASWRQRINSERFKQPRLKAGISAKIRMQESQSVNYGNGISDFQK
mgnify:CR=1 FL=1